MFVNHMAIHDSLAHSISRKQVLVVVVVCL